MQLKIEVLPAPLGPMIANSSPLPTVEAHAVDRPGPAEAQLEAVDLEDRLTDREVDRRPGQGVGQGSHVRHGRLVLPVGIRTASACAACSA
jgi:hypothetical protein